MLDAVFLDITCALGFEAFVENGTKVKAHTKSQVVIAFCGLRLKITKKERLIL